MRTFSQLFSLCTLCLVGALAACSGDSAVPPPGQPAEDCLTPGDEDGNGLADCSDPVCAAVSDCQIACGNGKLDPGEQCDDGNNFNSDGCESDCTRPKCGNGILDIGEKCDDGNALNGDGCDANCTLPACGNGILDTGEKCDDGNALNGDGCDATCTISALAYVKASNPTSGDQFGMKIALSADGSTMVIGAPLESSAATGVNGNELDESVPGAGAVYVFTRKGTLWVQQAYLKASNPGVIDEFGISVALSADGSTLAVGAILEDSASTGINGNDADETAKDAGAVYVFTRKGTTWAQDAYVKASNTGPGDQFGQAVALSADGLTLAVSALLESSAATGINGNDADNSAANSGAVYVYTRTDSTWSQQAYVKASNTEKNDQFGQSLALSSDGATLAVGALGEDSAATGINGNDADNTRSAAGAVYVYTRSGTTWSQDAYVKASNTAAGDNFGQSVALSADGSTLVVGALGEDSAATGINGNQADNLATNSGAVYVYTRSGTTWSQEAYVKASNTGTQDQFGFSLALSGDGSTLAVGAFLEDSAATGIGSNQADNSAIDSGAVYTFTRSGTTWSQLDYIKASNTGAGDRFGRGIALSADGVSLAIGAPDESSAANGTGGDQADNSAADSGAVYVHMIQ